MQQIFTQCVIRTSQCPGIECINMNEQTWSQRPRIYCAVRQKTHLNLGGQEAQIGDGI